MNPTEATSCWGAHDVENTILVRLFYFRSNIYYIKCIFAPISRDYTTFENEEIILFFAVTLGFMPSEGLALELEFELGSRWVLNGG